jgi:hypothetical protein
MLRGRTPLDLDVKQQHSEDSLKHYSEKQVQIFSIFLLRTDIILLACRNADKLREAARLRMQRWVPQILILYCLIPVDQGIALPSRIPISSHNASTLGKWPWRRSVTATGELALCISVSGLIQWLKPRKRKEEHAEWCAADAVTRQARCAINLHFIVVALTNLQMLISCETDHGWNSKEFADFCLNHVARCSKGLG